MARTRHWLLVLLGVAILGPLAAAAPSGPAPPALTLTASPVASPNGDGVNDTVVIAIALPEPSLITVTVEGRGETVATLAASVPAQAGTVRLTWDGRRAEGGRAPDGSYAIEATAVGAAGGAESTAQADVRIDTKPPAVRWITLRERPGAGPLQARYRVVDAAASVELALVARDRSGRQWVSASRRQPPGSHAEPWPLRRAGGSRIPPGAYGVALRATDDAGNASTSKARSVLVEYPVTAHVMRRVAGAGRLVALTFDDCNDGPAWTSILETLQARHVQASFFCLGPEIGRHAAQARRTLRDGHTVGNHSWTHAYLPARSYSEVQSELDRATETWWRLAKTAPQPYFRPAYGALSPTVLAAAGSRGYSRVVLWDVDPQDWRRPGVAAIVERATGPARAGSIVLLHVLPQTAAALPSIIARLRGDGLRPVSLDSLLAAAR
jgi:peptidoglycan/xylan/chitin deacetylase (PgdA/CDA1 family)